LFFYIKKFFNIFFISK
jgi:phosphoenolpyruvate carboxykinase (ATP)